MELLQKEIWSPYIVGFAIGLLSIISLIFSQKLLGTSTTYARIAAFIEQKIFPKSFANKIYYQNVKAEVDWQFMLVLGIALGSFLSASLSGSFKIEFLTETEYISLLNQTVLARFLSALIGGVFLGFGARLAKGCTSGHGISGIMQLAVTSWLAAITFFLAGIISAQIIF